jgi:hypothetical protein
MDVFVALCKAKEARYEGRSTFDTRQPDAGCEV